MKKSELIYQIDNVVYLADYLREQRIDELYKKLEQEKNKLHAARLFNEIKFIQFGRSERVIKLMEQTFLDSGN